MIPIFVRLGFRKKNGSVSRWWLPLFLVWILLLPIVVVIAPFALIVCLICAVNPLRAVAVFWELFVALRGTQIQVQDMNQFIDIDIL
ncbi:MAG: hypothetical protein AAB250_01385 [Bdellovibrionota bacterium]